MAKKSRKFDTRTVLIILLVIVIIGALYVIITNLPPEIDTLTPDDILRNKSGYLDQEVVVKGYFDFDGGNPVIVSRLSTTEGRAALKLDYSNIETNESDGLIQGDIYRFTGTIVEDTSNPIVFDVILVLEEFEKV